MAKLSTYTYTGTKGSDESVPAEWSIKPNSALLAQAIHIYKDRMHPGLAKSKSRGEIDLTTKKIYKQKGTGNARHGAKSAPIFVGGGTAHGPSGLKRVLTLSTKMRKVALNMALSLKVSEGKLLLVDGIEKFAKTKDAQKLVTALSSFDKSDKPVKKYLFVLATKNAAISRYVRNLKMATVETFSDLNAFKVYFGGVVVVDTQVLDEIKGKASNKKNSKIVEEKVSKKVNVKTVKKSLVTKSKATKSVKKTAKK